MYFSAYKRHFLQKNFISINFKYLRLPPPTWLQPTLGGPEAVRHVPDHRPPRGVPRLSQVLQDVLTELCRGLQGGHGI